MEKKAFADLTFAQRRDQWMRNLLKSPSGSVPSGAKTVGLRLALYMNEGKEYAFPSLVELAEATGLSPRVVQEHTLTLEREKWISAKRQRNTGNKYKLRYWWTE